MKTKRYPKGGGKEYSLLKKGRAFSKKIQIERRGEEERGDLFLSPMERETQVGGRR